MHKFTSLFLMALLVVCPARASYIYTGGGGLPTGCSDGQVPEFNTGTGAWACASVGGTGTVTTVNTNSTSSSIFTNTANVIGTSAVTLAFSTQAANKIFAGPTTGVNAAPTFRSLVGADLPVPAASTLGGVNSKASVSHNFLTQIGTDGSVSQAQPAFSDISGTATGAQLPTFTGDVTNVAAAMTVAKIQGVSVGTPTGTGNVVMSGSPVLTGTTTMASGTVSGSLKKGNAHLEPAEVDTGNTGASQALDLSTGTVFTYTLDASPTITISNPVAGAAYAIILTQDATGSRTVTWAGTSIIWGSGSSTLSTAANAVDKVTCVYNGNISKLMCDIGTGYL